jgi:Uma2 family endonuclease
MSMERDLVKAARRDGLTRPTWATALLFPNDGEWSEGDYLALPSNRLVELSEGTLEVLPMPTKLHQAIVFFLVTALKAFLRPRGGGEVVMAPYPVRLWPDKFREPDVVCVLAEHADRCGEKFAEGADLVMEVVSDSDPSRDRRTKRDEYARARIPEYWIVDPQEGTVTVLTLDGERYRERGVYRSGEQASSSLLDGFDVDVGDALVGGR